MSKWLRMWSVCLTVSLTCTAPVLQEILEGRPYDAKSDLWSLGCVVHELCTLRYVVPSRDWILLCLHRINSSMCSVLVCVCVCVCTHVG